jgi:mRNA interferase HigB
LRIIAKAKLRELWARYPETEGPLNAWYRVVAQQKWSSPIDVRNTYRSADRIGSELAVFDICNTKFRLLVRVDYGRSIAYIWDIYTHAQYGRLDLKRIGEIIHGERRQGESKR